ncbi:MAG: hypothetical protein H6569_10515 [Lewinellaceae bacterium]|nr:hypothetical protein [Lewinellaceae bacterium]
MTAIRHSAGNSVWVGTASRGLHQFRWVPSQCNAAPIHRKNGLAFNSSIRAGAGA